MDPDDLERIVDRELKKLPAPRAPHTLVPRVMASVQAWSDRPWYRRPWLTWPTGWQIASMAALLALIAGGSLLVPAAQAAAGDVVSPVAATVLSDVAAVAGRAETTTSVARVLWRTLIRPVALYGFILVLLMWVACAVFGVALDRVAFGKALNL